MPLGIAVAFVTLCHSGICENDKRRSRPLYTTVVRRQVKNLDSTVLANVNCTTWSCYKGMGDTLASSKADFIRYNNMDAISIAMVYKGLLPLLYPCLSDATLPSSGVSHCYPE